jgi:hypothetical protein
MKPNLQSSGHWATWRVVTWTQFYWSTWASALMSGVLLSERNYQTEHKETLFPCCTAEIGVNKTANGVIRDIINWLSQDVLYFNRILRFYGTHLNLISLTLIGKTRVFYCDSFHENHNSTALCSELATHFHQTRRCMWEKRDRKESGPLTIWRLTATLVVVPHR